jgi:uncharacterized peroxidase-related enzyme
MSRINTPATIDAAPAAARPLLEGVKARLGKAPNLYLLASHSPAALEGLLSLSGALGKGALDAATRERIALAIANVNGCDYCNAAHGYIAKNLVKLSDEEIARNRRGESGDAKANAAVSLAVAVARNRGEVTDAAFAAARNAGLSDAELVEVVAHVALNTFTNYINDVFGTPVDFPAAEPARRVA